MIDYRIKVLNKEHYEAINHVAQLLGYKPLTTRFEYISYKPAYVNFHKEKGLGFSNKELYEYFPNIGLDGLYALLTPKKTYKAGQRVMVDEEKSIVAQVGKKLVCIISLNDGNRWNNPIEVNDVHAITEEEMNQSCGEGWELIED